MSVRSCTCGAVARLGLVGVKGHYRDCVSLLPDPDTCEHKLGVKREGEIYCGACGKGLSEGARAWFLDKLAPGYAERVAEERAEADAAFAAARSREASYDLGGIYLDDGGITGQSDEDLATLIDCCTREQKYREAQRTPS